MSLFGLFLLVALSVPAPAHAELLDGCADEIGLNHFYVVLDADTYAAVLESPFFRDAFAAVDAGLPAFDAPTAESQRLFVRGRTTYLELFRPENRFGEPVGKVGLALGGDRPEALDCVYRRWAERLPGETERHRVERQSEGVSIPWYEAVYRAETSNNPDLVLWAAGYLPGFVPWLHPDRPAGVARTDVLGPRFDPERLLRDVTGLAVAVPPDLREGIAAQIEALGFARTELEDATTLEGADFTLTLTAATAERRGLLAVELATNRPYEALGLVPLGPRSLLAFGPGPRAVWYFL